MCIPWNKENIKKFAKTFKNLKSSSIIIEIKACDDIIDIFDMSNKKEFNFKIIQ